MTSTGPTSTGTGSMSSTTGVQGAEKGNLEPCAICGEPRGDQTPCPHCGMD
jgi:hypothetical protein